MDSKGFNFFVGLFVVAGIIGIFATGLWLARTDSTDNSTAYQIYFEESVSGLDVGSRVSYRGISIGTVSAINIRPDDPEYVQVRVMIKDAYPIHRGDVASLKLEGITGTSYVNIEGAQRGSEVLRSSTGKPAVIPSQKSDLEQLVQGVPALISEGTVLAQRFGEILNQQNRDEFTLILSNISKITNDLVEQSDAFGTTLATINATGKEVITLSRSLGDVAAKTDTLIDRMNNTADNANQLITQDTRRLISQWQDSAQSLRALTESAQTMLSANQDSLEHFSQEGLYELTLFLQEARLLVAGLTRVVDRVESSGARFLLDQHNPEIDPN
jgi:phospholipid/cholesterol/gamma-HCH transport system substrate-binding protein